MGYSVHRHSQPDRKRNHLERRLVHLRGVVKRGESPARMANAAEKVRLAALSLMKAKQALIREYPDRDPSGHQVRSLQAEEKRWLALSTGEIAEQYGKVDA